MLSGDAVTVDVVLVSIRSSVSQLYCYICSTTEQNKKLHHYQPHNKATYWFVTEKCFLQGNQKLDSGQYSYT